MPPLEDDATAEREGGDAEREHGEAERERGDVVRQASGTGDVGPARVGYFGVVVVVPIGCLLILGNGEGKQSDVPLSKGAPQNVVSAANAELGRTMSCKLLRAPPSCCVVTKLEADSFLTGGSIVVAVVAWLARLPTVSLSILSELPLHIMLLPADAAHTGNTRRAAHARNIDDTPDSGAGSTAHTPLSIHLQVSEGNAEVAFSCSLLNLRQCHCL